MRCLILGQAGQGNVPEMLDELCPNDGAQLAKRHGRFGEFTSCSNYPKCYYVKRETTGVTCPKDRGEIVVKRSRRGKAFYGCANYPKCDAVYWDMPVKETCPKCYMPFLLEKTTKAGTVRYCQNEDCDYKMAVDNASPASDKKTEDAVAV